MFEKIVLATDLSPAWNEIVACAGEFKALGCKQVILTYVISVKFMAGMEGILQSTARPKLVAQQQQLEAQGLQVTVEIPMGLPADSLNQIACRYGADLIVVGSHGQSLWREGVLGCFTCAVLHNAQYPVLLLNVRLQKPGLPGSCQISSSEVLRHVLLPTDFSEISFRALEYVERLAAKGIEQVTVLNALDVPGGEAYPPGFQEMAEAKARDSLAAWTEVLKGTDIPLVHPVFDPGHPLPAILRVLESQDVSLIVMGTQGKGFIKEIFLGSVAHNVSRMAMCPVLLIPPARR
ncbi:MAG: universal stress protein [Proteobacteria bacterium]|nr:universal stress protein [Pseudomonadota bacterium]MBU4446992.1 universal stress protein [Pseudomonadota bacterium]